MRWWCHRIRFIPVLLGVGLLLAACADIPGQTMPQVLDFGGGQSSQTVVPQPPKGAGPLDIVRDFIDASGDPTDNYANARAYLAGTAKDNWRSDGTVTLIGETFGTAPPSNTPRNAEPGQASSWAVRLHGELIGQVGTDHSFTPTTGVFDQSIQVAIQPDGSWRIVSLPDGVVTTVTTFLRYFQPVDVDFFDPSYSVLVPDTRYVATDPSTGLPSRVIDALLDGPSAGLAGAVRNLIPPDVSTQTNVTEDDSGALVVNLAHLPRMTEHDQFLMIVQIVSSLTQVNNAAAAVRVESDGVPLYAAHPAWRPADLPSYTDQISYNASEPGLAVSHGRALTLKDGSALPGAAGNGACQVGSAAQSPAATDADSELALVCQVAGRQQLRVQRFGDPASTAVLSADHFTRPTWSPGFQVGGGGREVWTVADGRVIRAVANQQGAWSATSVDATAFTSLGSITDLRLSRDGVRVAAVVGAWRSIFLGFHGGRGVATGIGAMFAIAPLVCLLAAPVFLIVIVLSRYVSLGSLLGSAAAAVIMLALVAAGILPAALLVFGVLGAIVVWLAHADNIDRLLHGQERKLDFTRSQRS